MDKFYSYTEGQIVSEKKKIMTKNMKETVALHTNSS